MGSKSFSLNRQPLNKKINHCTGESLHSVNRYRLAVKHPMLTAAVIASIGSLIWNAIAKPKS